MRISVFTSVSLLVLLVLPQGCSSRDEEAPSDVTSLELTCKKTQCERRSEDDQAACSSCLRTCGQASSATYRCDATTACRASCSPSQGCSEESRAACAEHGWVAKLPSKADAEIQSACERVRGQWLDTCRWDVDGIDCALFARTERNTVPMYECVVSRGCAKDFAPCAPAVSTFGTELCRALEASSGKAVCSAKEVAFLDANGDSWRDDVKAAVTGCTAAPKIEVSSCFQAWAKAMRMR